MASTNHECQVNKHRQMLGHGTPPELGLRKQGMMPPLSNWMVKKDQQMLGHGTPLELGFGIKDQVTYGQTNNNASNKGAQQIRVPMIKVKGEVNKFQGSRSKLTFEGETVGDGVFFLKSL